MFEGFASALVTGGLGMLGASKQNKAASALAQRQMDFQEEMSNTQYQRGVKDLKAAGLNPMLAYSQGGASSPSGATAPVVNELDGAISSAQASRRLDAEIDNMREQNKAIAATIDQSKSQTDLNKANADLSKVMQTKSLADASVSVNSAKNLSVQNELLAANIPAAVNEASYQKSMGSTHPWIRNAVQVLKDIFGTASSAKAALSSKR